MRVRIQKSSVGRSISRKEVALRINKAGLNADGSQRYCVALRFAYESYKKASNTDYVIVEIDEELGRLYFISSDAKEGYKLTCSNDNSTVKNISFSIDDVNKWKSYEGTYDLLCDFNEHVYYIDFAKKN